MKYREIIQFESIDEIIKFDKLDNEDYREKLIKTFVCSNAFENFIIPRISRELDLKSNQETRGIQIVGNYGTGKSHLMSLFSIIAEDETYLEFLSNEKAKKSLSIIAGKYKVIRFEISGTNSLWEIITYQIDNYFKQWGIEYSIYEDKRPVPYYDKLKRMMTAFEEKFPDKGFMLVIDEMLSYLQGHAQPHLLGADLQVLQALGHMSDRTRFRMIFGVQELIYQSPEFQFATEILSRVADRYTDLKIEKADVQFIVQERLLRKDSRQKQAIRQHLQKFTTLFPNINNELETFVKLFPVHPSYFDNFQQIKIGKSQREVLKTLSRKFESMLEDDIPTDNPGLICYDSYWEDIQRSQDLMAIADVRNVAGIAAIVDQKIEDWFTGGRAPKKPLAHRIVAASAIKILQADLTKTNGVLAESLANDLCYVDTLVSTYDQLVDLSFNTTLSNIVKATIGQYFEHNEENLEYHLRIEGGVNYKQNVINYASTMSDTVKDEYFFGFLGEILPVDWNVYRPNFRIWAHTINWASHNVRLPGYIFMGHPAAKSTTQPKQHFYLYFMPIFCKEEQAHNQEDDGIFFMLDDLSDEFREAVTLYGASQALINSASSVEKPNYRIVKDEFYKSARDKFNSEFISKTIVEFKNEKRPLSSLNPHGESNIDILNNVSSILLEDIFTSQSPDYPKFTNLQYPVTPFNRESLLKAARSIIVNPLQSNRNGEAILYGLGLWAGGHVNTDHSKYAQSLKKMLSKHGGKVLNQSEILKIFYEDQYVSTDFEIEADLEFIVMAAMAQLGEIEIVLNDKTHINSSNIQKILDLSPKDYYTFSSICHPKGINVPLVREISLGLLGQDRTKDLDNPQFYTDLAVSSQELANKAVIVSHNLQNGYRTAGIEILSPYDASALCNRFGALRGMCDQIRQKFNTKAKLRNIEWPKEAIHKKLFDDKEELEKWDMLLKEIGKFQFIINYLSQAQQYVATEEPLYSEIGESIKKLSTVITKGENARALYMTELKKLQNKYAEYYLAEYTANNLPVTDGPALISIRNMHEKQICDAVAAAVQKDIKLSIINTYDYETWKRKLAKVRIADTNVTINAILQNPYQGFNPAIQSGHSLPDLDELKNEIVSIYNELEEVMKSALDDPSVRENRLMLSEQEVALLDKFLDGRITLTLQYVHPLLEIIKKLSTNFDIKEITIDLLKSKFNHPLDVESARSTFEGIINDIVRRQQQQGKKHEDIRIIIN